MSCLPQWPKAHAKGSLEEKKHRRYFPWVFTHSASLMFSVPYSLLKISLVAWLPFSNTQDFIKHLRQETPLYMHLIFPQTSCPCEFSESTAHDILKRQRINLVGFVPLLLSAASFPITLKAVAAISHRFSFGDWGMGWRRKNNLSFWAAAHPNHSLLFGIQRGHWTLPRQ